MAVLKPYKGDYYLWKYLPSIPGSVIFIFLFLGIAVLQALKLRQTRAWFCTSFMIGCFLEVIGYLGRTVAHNETQSLIWFIIQATFTLIAPALYAASVYMTLGHLLRFLNAEHHSPIPAKWLTKAFVAGDIMSFMIQGNSSGLLFKKSTAKIGEILVVTGLMVQVISFTLFFITAIVVHRRINDQPTSESLRTTTSWRTILYMLYAVSLLILVRSIFRVVEYIQGADGFLLSTEWPLYVFDSVPMFVVAVAFWYWWPSEIRTARAGKRGPWWRMGF